MKRSLIVAAASWFFLATQYVGTPPNQTPLSPAQIGPFKTQKACDSVAAAYQSGQISLYNPSIVWQLTACYSSNGEATGITSGNQS